MIPHWWSNGTPIRFHQVGDLGAVNLGDVDILLECTGRLIREVLPKLKGRIEARAIRVPTASVSAVDLTIQTATPVTVAGVNSFLVGQASATPLLGWITQPLVTTDLRGRPESLILSGPETSVSVGGLLRLFGWNDNELGVSNRLFEMAHLIARRDLNSD